VAACSDELDAVLARFDRTRVPNVGAQPTAVMFPVLTPTKPIGAVAPARVASAAPPAGRPLPRIIVPTDSRRAAPAAVSIQAGMDRMGGDYKGFALGQPDPQLCRQACADDGACRSYTYVNPGLKGPQAMCFLKNATPPATANDCCTSGQKLEAMRR